MQQAPKDILVITKTLLVQNQGEAELGLLLAEFIKELEAIDTNDPKAKLNEMTMSDNNGGRIWI